MHNPHGRHKIKGCCRDEKGARSLINIRIQVRVRLYILFKITFFVLSWVDYFLWGEGVSWGCGRGWRRKGVEGQQAGFMPVYETQEKGVRVWRCEGVNRHCTGCQ